MKPKQIITVFLLILGSFQVFTYEKSDLSSASLTQQETTDSAVLSYEHSPLGHQHGCGDFDPCGHQCHFGHCGFAVLRGEALVTPDLSGNTLQFTSRIPPDSFIGSLFRPPLA